MKWPLDTPAPVHRRVRKVDRIEYTYGEDNTIRPERASVAMLGAIGAASLEFPAMEWSYITQEKPTRLRRAGKTSMLVDTSRQPQLPRARLHMKSTLVAAQDHLHKYYPDIDVPAELIKAELAVAPRAQQTDRRHGLWYEAKRNLLAVLGTARPLVCYPGGEVGQELHALPLTVKKSKIHASEPTHVLSFPTEIQHIVHHKYRTHVLAIRTMTSVTLVEIARRPGSLFDVRVIVEIKWKDLGNPHAPIVDMAFSPYDDSELLVVNEDGAVQIVSFGADPIVFESVLEDAATFDELKPTTGVWRCSWMSETEVIIASDKQVKIFDRKAPETSTVLHIVIPKDKKVSITSVEGPYAHPDSLVCITTTERLIWIDPLHPIMPFGSWRHERDLDPTLEARTILKDSFPVTVLSSQRNALVTIYDVRKNQDGGVLSFPAYSLVTSNPLNAIDYRRTGLALIPEHGGSQRGERASAYRLVELTALQSIHITRLAISDHETLSARETFVPPSTRPLDLSWFKMRSRPDMGPRGDRRYKRKRFSRCYDEWMPRLIHAYADASAELPSSFSTLALGSASDVWEQELEESDPAGRFVTTFDAAAGESHKDPWLRSGAFFTTITPSYSEIASSTDSEGTIQQLADKSEWALDITRNLDLLDPGFQLRQAPVKENDMDVDNEDMSDEHSGPSWLLPLSKFSAYLPDLDTTAAVPDPNDDDDDDAEYERERPATVKQIVDTAVETLAIDLSLSRRVFCNKRPIDPHIAPEEWVLTPSEDKDADRGDDIEVDDVMAALTRATRALSISQRLAPRQKTGFIRASWAPRRWDAEDMKKDLAEAAGTEAGGSEKTAKRKRKSTLVSDTLATSTQAPMPSEQPVASGSGLPHRTKGKGKQMAPPAGDSDEWVDTDDNAADKTDAPPPRPPPKPAKRNYTMRINAGRAGQALGVRILLQEWTIGEDPRDYVFNPVYAPDNKGTGHKDTQAKAKGKGKAATGTTASQSQSQQPKATGQSQSRSIHQPPNASSSSSQAPPLRSAIAISSFPSARAAPTTAVASSSQPMTLPGPTRTFQSQAQSLGDVMMRAGNSQEVYPMSNTQVLPGPFGGRQQVGSAPKKPPAKKKRGF